MIAGIDLGTTHSLVAMWRDGRAELVPNALGEVLTPSVVGIDDDGTILVGQAARERLQTHPELTAAVFKRAMGTAKTFKLGQRSFRAEELSALVLRALKADLEAALGEIVTQVVVTVPAYFSDAQRQATRTAATLAGFTQAALLNEPTAAALAYGMHQKQSETQFLVFDLGGGTFDVSVLEMFDGVMEVRATAGDNHLGGEDIDQLLIAHFVKETALPEKDLHHASTRAQLAARMEAAKKALSLAPSAKVSIDAGGREYALTLTGDALEACIKPLLDRLRMPVERAMRDARLRPAELDAVVLAGGSTRLSYIRQWATRMFGRFPETALNPDEVVALGAAVQGGLKMKDAALSERVMTDVCPYTLGIETSREMSQGRLANGFMAPILERNTIIPASRVQSFSPVVNFQTELRLKVYQGEGRRVSENILLGEFSVPLPSARIAEVSVDVRFTYDVNGLLEVEATVNKNGQKAADPVRLVIKNVAADLSPEEVAERIKALQALKIHPRDQLEIRTLMARGERLHSQLLGQAREHLAMMLTRFEVELESQDERRIATMKRELAELLNALDSDRFLPNNPDS